MIMKLLNYLEFNHQLICYDKGLPLALAIIGADLWGRNEMEWKRALDKYEILLDKDIQKPLQISYQELDETERDSFLDIACFFKRLYKDYVANIQMHAMYTQLLIFKNLLTSVSCITIDRSNKLWIHDLLQQMGKELF